MNSKFPIQMTIPRWNGRWSFAIYSFPKEVVSHEKDTYLAHQLLVFGHMVLSLTSDFMSTCPASDGDARWTQAIYTSSGQECPMSSGGGDLVLSFTEVLVVGTTSLV